MQVSKERGIKIHRIAFIIRLDYGIIIHVGSFRYRLVYSALFHIILDTDVLRPLRRDFHDEAVRALKGSRTVFGICGLIKLDTHFLRRYA